MKALKIFYTVFLFLLVAKCSFGQDVNFSQFYDLPMLRNPALAGIFTGDVRFTSAYRNQWESVTTPYRTVALGIELKKSLGENSGDFLTYGIQVTKDMAGDSKLSRTQVFPVLNYHKSLSSNKDSYLSAAFMGGPVMQQFDPSKLTFDDQYVGGAYSQSNPTRQTFSTTKLTYWDPAVGLCYSSVAGENTTYYIGAGVYHFTKPKVAFQKQNDISLNTKYVLNAGFSTALNYQSKLTFYGDYFTQGGSSLAQGGLLFTRDLDEREDKQKLAIAGGLFYRLNDAFIPVVKLEYYQLGIGITYDVNSSKLKTASQSRGGFECTLSYKGFRHNRNSSLDMVRCPRFF
ncbi:MAG: PorP/SprF family type IX secretion system membrane protein [Ferruginibacter sp.]|nr:PorP/SprF family type IX secretion system membrane protein [Ferruginibacter sp.]